jgi:effector-binding domain-containing protein
MRSLKWTPLFATLALAVICAVASAQVLAPQPPGQLIMGVKTAEPATVLEKTFTSTPDKSGEAIQTAAEAVFGAVGAEGITVLPNHAAVVVLTPMQELMAGPPAEMKWALRVPIVDALEPGPMEGHPDVNVARLESALVGYTYGKGAPEAVAQERTTALAMWLAGQGYTLQGPISTLLFQDYDHTPPDQMVCEIQVGIKAPAEQPAQP